LSLSSVHPRKRIARQKINKGNLLMKKVARLNIAAALVSLVGIAALPTARAQTGVASIYQGGKTADGEIARKSAMSAAHKTLPFGTLVRVTSRRSGRSVVVRINDRGPYVRGRIIDLTPAAARALGCSGLPRVDVEVVGHEHRYASHTRSTYVSEARINTSPGQSSG
jgi:rare lipoprotein A